jgi:tRNA(Ile)-lysidine synthetase-like protein
VRSRRSGDSIRLSGGTKSLKKLFIDLKIPAARRASVPVLYDDFGILAIPGIGVNLDRAARTLPATRIEYIP